MGRYNNRATHPLNSTVKGMMRHDIRTGRYIIEEDGTTYSMEMEEIRNLGNYYTCFVTGAEKYPTLERWYRDLPNETKKRIIRTGRVRQINNGFYPDMEWD